MKKIFFSLTLILGLLFIFCGHGFAAPVLSNEEMTSLSDTQAIITWVTSNESATTGIHWGIGLPTNTSVTDEGDSITKYHYATLSNLFPDTVYYYYVFSTSATGTTESVLRSFRTLARPSGEYLFTFATLTDTHAIHGVDNTENERGRAYALSEAVLTAQINAIKTQFNPSFLIIKGDIIDAADGDIDPTTYVENTIKPILDNLEKPYYTIPGNHDKYDRDGYNWVTHNLGILYPDLAAVSQDTDSVFNYAFENQGYRFIMLDSSVADGTTAQVDLTALEAELQTAQTNNQKAFIFMHHSTSKEADLPTEILKAVLDEDTWEESDWDKIRLTNKAAFLSLLDDYKLDNDEPVVASVFMGHIHDSRKREFNGVPFVRTSSGLQFPAGYNVYKVYSNGYIQTFYKTPGYSEEITRDLIAGAGSATASRNQQYYMGALNERNFTQTYSATSVSPSVANTAPAANAANIPTNSSILIRFTKAMANDDSVSDWLRITAGGSFVSLSSSEWSWNSDKTKLTIDKTLTASTVYTVTILSAAAATDNTTFGADYSFSFTTGTSASSVSPIVSIDRLKNTNGVTTDITQDTTPTFTGIATDEGGAAIINIEFRYASGTWSSWQAATALDGSFDSATELFTFSITSEIARGQHEIQLRTTNSAGISTEADFGEYTFYVIGSRPEIILTADGTEIINSDPIKTDPSFEVTVVTDNQLSTDNLLFYVNNLAVDPDSTSQENNNTITYATYKPTLAEGAYNIRIEATDNEGNLTTKEATNLLVQTAGPAVIYGVPLNYPNPFNPGGSRTTIISYVLSKASNVQIKILDLAGNIISAQTIASGSDGARVGYNEITWDGKSADGNYVGNGIYLYLIIIDGKVIQNGKGKIAVYKQ
ncbi:MAG: Ig-like domain-containing protein [bacterium]